MSRKLTNSANSYTIMYRQKSQEQEAYNEHYRKSTNSDGN